MCQLWASATQRKRLAHVTESALSVTCRYAMLCYAKLCCATLCYDMLCYPILCQAMLCHDMICHAMLCHGKLCYAMRSYAILCYATPCHGIKDPWRLLRVLWCPWELWRRRKPINGTVYVIHKEAVGMIFLLSKLAVSLRRVQHCASVV